MFGIGWPELFLVAVILVVYLIPVVVIVWIVAALRTIRARQETLLGKVDAIERALQRDSKP
jgi:hypothetical protein